MSDGRRTGLTEEELDTLANKLLEKISKHNVCCITSAEQTELKTILTTKKWAVRATLTVTAIIVGLAVKDAYLLFKAFLKLIATLWVNSVR